MRLQKLDWCIFDLTYTNLGRIDLYYDRRLKKNDTDLHLFLKNSYQRVCSKSGSLSAKLGDSILRIGKRSSCNFFRVYLRPNGKDLRFEIELKKTLTKKFQCYLFANQFQAFEKSLTKHFYGQATRLFNLEDSYCDWLLASFRHVRGPINQEALNNYLSTSYLTNKLVKNLDDIKFFCLLILLLNYIKSLKSSSRLIKMSDTTYRIVEFSVNDFLEFTGKPRNNYYQIKKLVQFLRSLQSIEPILENFSDGSFQSYVAFPYLKVERKKGWYVKLSVCQKLYSYLYPFDLPVDFLVYQDNFELKVKFFVLKSFCSVSICKEFHTQELLGQVSISNSKNARFKKYIVTTLNKLKDSKLIEPKFQVLTKQNTLKEVDVLTSRLISQSESIFYTENITNRWNY